MKHFLSLPDLLRSCGELRYRERLSLIQLVQWRSPYSLLHDAFGQTPVGQTFPCNAKHMTRLKLYKRSCRGEGQISSNIRVLHDADKRENVGTAPSSGNKHRTNLAVRAERRSITQAVIISVYHDISYFTWIGVNGFPDEVINKLTTMSFSTILQYLDKFQQTSVSGNFGRILWIHNGVTFDRSERLLYTTTPYDDQLELL